MEHIVLLEKLIVTQLVKTKINAFCKTKQFITLYITDFYWSLL